MGRQLVFVYGSLLRGLPNHDVLPTGAVLEGAARTQPAFTMVDLGAFPGAVDGGETALVGEAYALDAAALAALDRFEGCPQLYRRAQVVLADGRDAWIYLLNSTPALDATPVVAPGCWRTHLATRGRR